jgi:aminoglycoside phosphotransferase (APT) family kinase protein
VVRIENVLSEALPGVEHVNVRVLESGWDSRVIELGDEWILRVARNRWAAKGYRIEEALLPHLAPTLSAAIPVPVGAGQGWVLTRRIAGTPAGADAGAALGSQLAVFLEALHAFPVDDARARGAETERRAADVEQFRSLVLPLLRSNERADAERLLDEHLAGEFDERVTHADLGPEHILVADGSLAGVIDWTDARIGDPAVDLAWPLHGAPGPLAKAFAERYGVDAQSTRRALLYHALGPWHEVVHGLRGDAAWIASGLEGVRERLRKVAEGAATMDA